MWNGEFFPLKNNYIAVGLTFLLSFKIRLSDENLWNGEFFPLKNNYVTKGLNFLLSFILSFYQKLLICFFIVEL